jgi:hypothetical protein
MTQKEKRLLIILIAVGLLMGILIFAGTLGLGIYFQMSKEQQ